MFWPAHGGCVSCASGGVALSVIEFGPWAVSVQIPSIDLCSEDSLPNSSKTPPTSAPFYILYPPSFIPSSHHRHSKVTNTLVSLSLSLSLSLLFLSHISLHHPYLERSTHPQTPTYIPIPILSLPISFPLLFSSFPSSHTHTRTHILSHPERSGSNDPDPRVEGKRKRHTSAKERRKGKGGAGTI